jgi:hypothetical protein
MTAPPRFIVVCHITGQIGCADVDSATHTAREIAASAKVPCHIYTLLETFPVPTHAPTPAPVSPGTVVELPRWNLPPDKG